LRRSDFHRQRFGRAYRDSGNGNGNGNANANPNANANANANANGNGGRWKRGKRIAKNCLSVLLAGAGATCGALLYLLDRTVEAIGPGIRLPSYPWEFEGWLTSLDHSAVRRGWQVYKNVCYSCHSLRYMRFMDLINVTHTEDEVKAIAAEFEVKPPIVARAISLRSRGVSRACFVRVSHFHPVFIAFTSRRRGDHEENTGEWWKMMKNLLGILFSRVIVVAQLVDRFIDKLRPTRNSCRRANVVIVRVTLFVQREE